MTVRTINGVIVYFVAEAGRSLSSEQDALDLLGETYGTGAEMIAVPVERFGAAFFDLSSRQAGHFFQKLQNYRMRLAIMGDPGVATMSSKALRDFVGETNRIGHHLFVSDLSTLERTLGGAD